MSKCPPAEACRDAFERMSKATVQMCMSTTGFGLGMDGNSQNRNIQSHSSIGKSDSSTIGEDSNIKQEDSQHSQRQQHQHLLAQQQQKSKRPKPRFDMNLKDLFPEDLDSSSLMSQNLPQSIATPAQRSQQQQQMSMRPPQLPHRQQYQAQLQSPQQQQNRHGNAGINADLSMDTNPTAGSMNSDYAQQQTQSSQSMPFYNTSVYGSNFMEIPGMDFDFDTNMENSGIDLGFGGLDLDFQRDWSDPGVGVDMFDGFFFGNGLGNNGLGSGESS
jgi:hypothetical protein